MSWVNAVVQGLLLGGLYALFAAGLSLMFGVMRLVNLAHGDLSVLAAFVVFVTCDALGWNPVLGLAVAVPAMAVVGYALQRGVLNASMASGALAPLLVTFGLSIVLQNLFQEIFSADQRRVDTGSFGTASLELTDQVVVAWFDIVVLGLAVVVLASLQLLLARSKTGQVMRATSQDPEAARACGIDARHVYGLVTATALATLALAGALLAMRTTFAPSSGPILLIFAFEAVVIGGLGSLWGTLAGGLVLGVAQTVGAQVDPAYGVLSGHLVFLAVLALRPVGLVGARRYA